MMNVHVVIDRTGSMAAIKDDAIGGFNEFLERTKGKAQRWWVWLFDSEGIDLISENVTPGKVEKLTNENYQPRAMTPLYDAVGKALAKAREFKASKNVFVVLTDGHENASREWTSEQVAKELDAIESEGWQLVFIAAGKDAWDASSMFVDRGVVVQAAGTPKAYGASMDFMSCTVSAYASGGTATKSMVEVDESGNVQKKKSWEM